MLNIKAREQELRKRLAYPYRWGRKQNDADDARTNFVYRIASFDELLKTIHANLGDDESMRDYALNRWYNFWSARAVEEIFCSLDAVVSAKERDKLVDFSVRGIRFDHKTSVFPRRFEHNLQYAQSHPLELIRWLYENQSQQGRKHFGNRLFIVLANRKCLDDSWKLKAELIWLRSLIQNYVQSFNSDRLHKANFEPNKTTLADIIWAVRES
jgi:hypothetical protein